MAHELVWKTINKTRRTTGDAIVFHSVASEETTWDQIELHVRETLLKALPLFIERFDTKTVASHVDALHLGVSDIGTLRLCLSCEAQQWADDGPFVLLSIRLVNRTLDRELLPHLHDRPEWVRDEHRKLRQHVFDAVVSAAQHAEAKQLLTLLRERRALRAIGRIDEESDEPVFTLDL